MVTKDHLVRQYDVLNGDALYTPITVIGAGAIGSFTTLCLAKSGYSDITVIDDDSVCVENMNNQFFRISDIGSSKVMALQSLVFDFTGERIKTIFGRIDHESKLSVAGIVLVCVDSMKARSEIANWLSRQYRVSFAIDTRMAVEFLVMQTFNPHRKAEMDAYRKTLYSDAEAVEERCTAKATAYTSSGAACLITKAVKDFTMCLPVPKRSEFSIRGYEMVSHMRKPD